MLNFIAQGKDFVEVNKGLKKSDLDVRFDKQYASKVIFFLKIHFISIFYREFRANFIKEITQINMIMNIKLRRKINMTNKFIKIIIYLIIKVIWTKNCKNSIFYNNLNRKTGKYFQK